MSLMAPVWSPDGKKIAVTGDNYIGIWVANADGSGLKQVSDELGAGYKMNWLNNSTIVSTPYTIVNDRRMTSIEQVNVETGKVTEVAAAEHNFKRSKAAVKTNKYYKLMVDDPAGATSQIPVLKDYAGRMIINPQLSHDGTMIAFQIVGKGIFMIDNNATTLLPAANLSYIKQRNTFELIDNMEFLNDRYAQLMLSWDLDGKLFNRIPLLKRLKWREYLACHMLWGTLTDRNNPLLERNAGDGRLFYFPGKFDKDGNYQYLSRR